MRIVAISDLHGQFPKVPPCDLLIVAGDVCPDYNHGSWARHNPGTQWQWFREKFAPWARKQAKRTVITWGNHDFCGEAFPYSKVEGIDIIVDEKYEYGGVKLWLTPWSNQFMRWAWMKEHDQLAERYALIPEGIDILVSHQPPQGYGDLYPNFKTGQLEHIASSELLYTIDRVKPQAVICGHLHGGYGTYYRGDTIIYNASVVNEQYQLTNPATEIPIEIKHIFTTIQPGGQSGVV